MRKVDVLTKVFVLFFGGLGYFLIFSFPIVGKPAGNLLPGQACFLRKFDFVIFLQIWMLDVLEEPFL